jgi:hypothetical protein
MKSKKLITFEELCYEFGISKDTMWRKLKPLKKFLSVNNQRKRFYTQTEIDFILKNIKL